MYRKVAKFKMTSLVLTKENLLLSSSSSSLYAGYLELYTVPETNHVYRVYSVQAILQLQFMVDVILLPMLNVLYYFLKYVCRAQYGCFLYFLDFVLSRYVAQVFSEGF
jgi:hypothetical protein